MSFCTAPTTTTNLLGYVAVIHANSKRKHSQSNIASKVLYESRPKEEKASGPFQVLIEHF